MTLDEIELLAMEHKSLPEFTPLPETCFYWSMRNLHDCVKHGRMQREDASKEKQRAIRRYHEFNAAYDSGCELYKERQKCIRLGSQMMNDIVKEEDPAKAAALAYEVISLMTGDTVFLSTMRKKADV
jgi:uncharacterized cysteine cluster protein YcgN (CxxCxxCC family)